MDENSVGDDGDLSLDDIYPNSDGEEIEEEKLESDHQRIQRIIDVSELEGKELKAIEKH